MKQTFWAFIAISLLICGASRAGAPLPWYDTVDEVIDSGALLPSWSGKTHMDPRAPAPRAGTSPWYDTALEAAMAQIRTHEAAATTGKIMGSTPPALLATQSDPDVRDPTWEDIKRASLNSWGLVPPTVPATHPTGYASRSWPSPEHNSPVYKGGCAENGSCYGDISSRTGQPKTTYVNGYYRKNGTYVRGHYRSSSSRK